MISQAYMDQWGVDVNRESSRSGTGSNTLLNRILKLKPTSQLFITDLIGVHSPNLEVVPY